MQEEQLTEARILVVDDEPQNVRYVLDVLKWAGYQNVEGISDPLEAVRRFREIDPDLVILDLIMPELDGFGVMEAIGNEVGEDAYLPILVLTSDISSESRRRALGGGARDFLTKPMSPTEVRLRVANLLETRFLYLRCAEQQRRLDAAGRTERAEGGGEEELELLERWAASLDAGLSRIEGHARRVSWLAGRLAEGLDLSAAEARRIRRAALLHDLGTRRILSVSARNGAVEKPAREAGERPAWDTVRPDPATGARLLEGSELPVLRTAREILAGLSARWDGGGGGPQRSGIPVAARIVAVAERFDELTHGPDVLSVAQAIASIEDESGGRFDPAVVAALARSETVRA
ncbi:MAG: response regulator [Gemmatimonadota bacterium]